MSKSIVCIPTLNEAGNVGHLIADIQCLYPELDVLVIDDNSNDGTQAVVKGSERFNSNVYLIEHSSRHGFAKSYIAGFNWALKNGYEVIGQMDADLSHPPRFLKAMIERLNFSDFVVGSRYIRGGKIENWSILRRLLSRFGNAYAKAWIKSPIQDQTGGFNFWKRSVLENLPLTTIKSDGYAFQIELKALASSYGYRGSEQAITFEERIAEKSKMTLGICFEALLSVPSIGLKQSKLIANSGKTLNPDRAKVA